MKILINGKEHDLGAKTAITKLLDQLGIPRPGTAVAINGTIVPHDRHETHLITDGDKVDILRAIGGG